MTTTIKMVSITEVLYTIPHDMTSAEREEFVDRAKAQLFGINMQNHLDDEFKIDGADVGWRNTVREVGNEH